MKKTKQKIIKKSTENKEPEIVKKQHDIHTHLYKFRFLNRLHLQTLLNHKSRTYVINWLNDLTERKYIKRYYTEKMKLAGLPAIYCLGLKGRKYLKKLRDKKGHKEFRLAQLNRVYKEYGLSMAFKIKCMSVAEIYLSLIILTKKTNAKLTFYTKVDLKGMKYLVYPAPDAYFSIEEKSGIVKRYFLDFVDIYMTQDDLEKRIRKYIAYFKKNDWQNHTGHPFPEIIVIVSNNSLKASIHNYVAKKLVEESVNMNFYLSTREEIKQQGINKNTLHKVKVKQILQKME